MLEAFNSKQLVRLINRLANNCMCRHPSILDLASDGELSIEHLYLVPHLDTIVIFCSLVLYYSRWYGLFLNN